MKVQSIATVISVLCLSLTATAQQRKEDLAKEIANPITSVTTVPFQFNYDSNIGPGSIRIDQLARWKSLAGNF